MKTMCHIHSLGGKLAEVEILEHVDNNKVTVLYNGVKCTAIFNIFVGAYYADDIYGVIQE